MTTRGLSCIVRGIIIACCLPHPARRTHTTCCMPGFMHCFGFHCHTSFSHCMLYSSCHVACCTQRCMPRAPLHAAAVPSAPHFTARGRGFAGIHPKPTKTCCKSSGYGAAVPSEYPQKFATSGMSVSAIVRIMTIGEFGSFVSTAKLCDYSAQLPACVPISAAMYRNWSSHSIFIRVVQFELGQSPGGASLPRISTNSSLQLHRAVKCARVLLCYCAAASCADNVANCQLAYICTHHARFQTGLVRSPSISMGSYIRMAAYCFGYRSNA